MTVILEKSLGNLWIFQYKIKNDFYLSAAQNSNEQLYLEKDAQSVQIFFLQAKFFKLKLSNYKASGNS